MFIIKINGKMMMMMMMKTRCFLACSAALQALASTSGGKSKQGLTIIIEIVIVTILIEIAIVTSVMKIAIVTMQLQWFNYHYDNDEPQSRDDSTWWSLNAFSTSDILPCW